MPLSKPNNPKFICFEWHLSIYILSSDSNIIESKILNWILILKIFKTMKIKNQL